MNQQPALFLLLTIGFLQFWLMPAIAWVLLKGQRNTAAKFWFAGTVCYAFTASLFVLQGFLPAEINAQASFILVTTMLVCLLESLRQELQSTPTRWAWFAAAVGFNTLLMVWVTSLWSVDGLRVTQVLVISCWDVACMVLLGLVIRKHRSRALLFVMLGFAAVVLTNMLRLHAFWSRGESTVLLSYSTTSNLGFVANYISVVLYSFGYWGFVVEKNRKALEQEISERQRAQAGETRALDREQLTLELLRQRDELIAQLAKMQRAVQAGALAASIAHEISQPLTSVRLSVDEALELHRQGQNNERITELIERIAKETRRATVTVQTLRDIFRGQQNTLESRTIDEIVKTLCAQMNGRIAKQQVTLATDLQAPVHVHVGAGELEHVILNLVTNALDAVAQASTQDPHLEITTRLQADSVVLQISDNGPGVPQHMRERLFEIYSGSNPSGLGLGLWLSRYIVERHGGQLLLDQAKQVGAAFKVVLPKALAA